MTAGRERATDSLGGGEAADHLREPPGDVDRRRVLEVRPHDLNAHGQPVARESDGCGRRGEARQRREGDPEERREAAAEEGAPRQAPSVHRASRAYCFTETPRTANPGFVATNGTARLLSVRTKAKLSVPVPPLRIVQTARSEEHTSELQSQSNIVCRLLLEKKKNTVKFREKTVGDPRVEKPLSDLAACTESRSPVQLQRTLASHEAMPASSLTSTRPHVHSS